MLFLIATKPNVRFDLFSHPRAIPELMQEMAQILEGEIPPDPNPHGHAKPVKHTSRRPVEQSWSLDSLSFAKDNCLTCYLPLNREIMGPK
jgi:hypothetical protein